MVISYIYNASHYGEKIRLRINPFSQQGEYKPDK